MACPAEICEAGKASLGANNPKMVAEAADTASLRKQVAGDGEPPRKLVVAQSVALHRKASQNEGLPMNHALSDLRIPYLRTRPKYSATLSLRSQSASNSRNCN